MRFPSFKTLRTRRSAPLFSIVALCLALFAACGKQSGPMQTSQTSTPAGTTQPRTSQPMPPVTQANATTGKQSFTLLDNRRQKLPDYLGHVVVLDFWATYCPPCVEEAPHLDALQRRYAAEGLHVIGLNVGGEDDRPKVPEFARSLNIQYTLGYPDPEMTEMFMSDDDRIPQTFVFDRKGKLVKHFVGYDQAVEAELEQLIKTSLAAGAD